MSDGIYSALSGAIAQERNLTVVANNVANTNTTGFKADKSIFAEVMKQVKDQEKLQTAPSLRYAVVNELSIDHQSGGLKATGRPLDAGLQGDGYFTIRTADGERYTRAGDFVQDADGVLRTKAGHEVLQTDSDDLSKPGVRIVIPATAREVRIGQDGNMYATLQDAGTLPSELPLGKLKVVRFDGYEPMQREGLTLFSTKAGVQPQAVAPTTTVEQGYLESANVNAVSGMNELITVNRSFDALQKVIETFRDLDDRTARDVAGKV
jgi:flagellar basal-body rod protein FlgF